jgi:hypothetical protein
MLTNAPWRLGLSAWWRGGFFGPVILRTAEIIPAN